MHEPIGHAVPISETRRFIMDLVHHARGIPTVPVARTITIARLTELRLLHHARPSWAVIFMKAYALVAAAHAPLRRAYLGFPYQRFYEHPQTICALAVEREHREETGIFVGLFRAPEIQPFAQLQQALEWYKYEPLENIGIFRQTLRISRLPRPVRRVLWWSTLNVSGLKRAKRFGTFGLTSYGSLGAESLHPISPLTTTFTYGPIEDDGKVIIKLIYDHRVLDGAYIARRLRDIEEALLGPIAEELAECRNTAIAMPVAVAVPATGVNAIASPGAIAIPATAVR